MGDIWSKFKSEGSSQKYGDFINREYIYIEDGTQIPGNVTYAMYKNIKCYAMNKAIFKKMETNQRKDPHDIPDNSIFITSFITYLKRKTHFEECLHIIKNIIHSSCCDIHVT